MFTGIVGDVGRITSRVAVGGDVRLGVATDRLDLTGVAIGDSIAVSGVCLTVVAREARSFAADVSIETLNRTTLGALTPGAAVNLEPALRVGDRLGGHFVSGHVDAIGRVRARTAEARGERWWFDAPVVLHPLIAEKGSIAVDGVSLTVASVDELGFSIALIPHTLAVTTIGALGVGAAVNLEADLIARHIVRALAFAPR